MDSFGTPYDDGVEVEFIKCEVCDKSIRGETFYKIHVTSSGHLKNEDALVAEGQITRQQTVPEFEDIIQFLDYLNLDEPIIGLDYIVEIPDNFEASGFKYSCKLCNVQACLTETVHHIIGRKHRKSYLTKNRPDLATWDKQPQVLLPAKVIRTKAEVAERQDGRGTPKLLPNKTKTRRPGFSGFHGGKGQRSYTTGSERYLPDNSGRPSFPEEMQGDTYSYNDHAEKIQRATLSKSQAYIETGDCQGYYDKGREIFSGGPEFHDYNKLHYGHTQREGHYTNDHRKPYAEKDLLKEFYTEELRREQRAKAQQPPQAMHLEDSSQQWPRDSDFYQHKDMNRAGRQSGSDLEANMSSFATDVDGRNSHKIFKLIKDYQHNVLASGHQDEAFSNPGPSRVRPSRPGDMSRKMSDIPDPFMRFLQGGNNREEPGIRKRKSRFADATIEELQAAKASFVEDYGPPDSKFPSLRLPQHTDPYTESQAAHCNDPERTESYQRELLPEYSESTGDTFDMLKNIEIENAEEANFLKEKLCNVLREFKARKSDKTAQTSQGRAVVIKDYNNVRPVTELGTQDHYERLPRENTKMGRAEEHYNDHRQSNWDQRENIMDKAYEEYPVFSEPRHSRSPIKEVNRWTKNQPQHGTVLDKPTRFPEKYQEPLQFRDYQSADEYFDYQLPRSHLPMERGTRMHRAPQYSRNLDKITSTLLEMVARK